MPKSTSSSYKNMLNISPSNGTVSSASGCNVISKSISESHPELPSGLKDYAVGYSSSIHSSKK